MNALRFWAPCKVTAANDNWSGPVILLRPANQDYPLTPEIA